MLRGLWVKRMQRSECCLLFYAYTRGWTANDAISREFDQSIRFSGNKLQKKTESTERKIQCQNTEKKLIDSIVDRCKRDEGRQKLRQIFFIHFTERRATKNTIAIFCAFFLLLSLFLYWNIWMMWLTAKWNNIRDVLLTMSIKCYHK